MRVLALVLFGLLVAAGTAHAGPGGAEEEAAAAGAAMTDGAAAVSAEKGKRQTRGEVVVAAPAHYAYRAPRRQHQYEQVAAVHEQQEEGVEESARIPVREDYRPGQVFSLNPRELFELEPERKAPYVDQQQLQRVYQDEQAQQVALQPSHAVIVRPSASAGGEAHVGAALSVSDAGANAGSLNFDRELLALLGHTPENFRSAAPQDPQERPFQPMYANAQSSQKYFVGTYPQAERYNSKPLSKAKPTKSRPKLQPTAPPPQQYLIETTNPQPVRQQVQAARPQQSLRYVAIQPAYYERPEAQGLKIVPAPQFQPAVRPQAYRYISQPQPEGTAQKQYRMYQDIKQVAPKARPEQVRYAPSVERPVAYSNRYQPPKQAEESVERYYNVQQSTQSIGDQYYIRPVYRTNDQRGRYELTHLALGSADAARALEPLQRPAHSTIYVSKNTAPKKTAPTPRPPLVSVERHGESLEEQRARLPPPRNNKAYTPEEFEALVAAGYSVTPVPVHEVQAASAQARSDGAVEAGDAPTSTLRGRRPQYSRRAPQYLPFRGDDAP